MPQTDPQLAAWRSLLAAHAGLIDALGTEMREAHGLPLSWYEVLLYLHESGEGRLRMHELAGSLLLSRSAATRFVERMEKAGLVTRTPCADDRRGTFVEMTAQGREAFRETAPSHLAGIRRHFADHVSDREAEVILTVMNRLQGELETAAD